MIVMFKQLSIFILLCVSSLVSITVTVIANSSEERQRYT